MVRIEYYYENPHKNDKNFPVKHIVCDNIGEFLSEFKKWHENNKGVIPPKNYDNEERFDLYVGFDGEGYGDFWPRDEKGRVRIGYSGEQWKDNGELHSIATILGPYHNCGGNGREGKVSELAYLVLNIQGFKYNDWKPYEEKLSQALRQIWTTGSADTSSLDLNWPQVASNKNFPDQTKPEKLGGKGSKKELGKMEIYSIFAIFGAIFVLVFWLIKRKKNN